MKTTVKQKALSLAVFGLLAANSSYKLMSQGSSLFAYNNIEEGQISLASVSTQTFFRVEGKKSSGEQESLAKIIGIEESRRTKKQKIDSVNNLPYVEIKISNATEEEIKYFKSSDRMSEGLFVEKESSDIASTSRRSNTSKNTLVLRYYEPKIGTETKINGKLQKITLSRLVSEPSIDILSDGIPKISYKVDSTEGKDLGLCDKCGPLPEIKVENIALIAEQLEEAVKTVKKRNYDEEQIELAKTCEDQATKSKGSDAQLKCLIDDLEGRRDRLGLALDTKTHKRSNDLLADILTGKFTEDEDADFSDFYKYDDKRNPRFKELALKTQRQVSKELANVAAKERKEEQTELYMEALEKELATIDGYFDSYNKNISYFDNLKNNAVMELSQMEMSCGGGFGSGIGSSNTPDYFAGQFSFNAGFNMRDGFYAGRTQNPTMSATNPMGGSNQFSSMNAIYEQQQREYQRSVQQNCMQNVAGTKQWYNWELAQIENNRIKPLIKELEYRTNSLDVARIFGKESPEQGGINPEDRKYYEQLIRQNRNEFLALNSSSNNSILGGNDRLGSVGTNSSILPRSTSPSTSSIRPGAISNNNGLGRVGTRNR